MTELTQQSMARRLLNALLSLHREFITTQAANNTVTTFGVEITV